jgi:hypothetical protein
MCLVLVFLEVFLLYRCSKSICHVHQSNKCCIVNVPSQYISCCMIYMVGWLD